MIARILTGASALALLAGAALAEGNLKVGYVTGLTGACAPIAEDGLNGSKLAVEALNAKGGILGQDQVRACESDADCSAHSLVDRTFELDAVDDPANLPKSGSGKVLWSSLAKTAVAKAGGGSIREAMERVEGFPEQLLARRVELLGPVDLNHSRAIDHGRQNQGVIHANLLH